MFLSTEFRSSAVFGLAMLGGVLSIRGFTDYGQHLKHAETAASEINPSENQRAGRACPNRHHTTMAFIVPVAEMAWEVPSL
jgi:hypothetical protein